MKQKDWTEALRDRLKDAQIAPPAEGWEEPLPNTPLSPPVIGGQKPRKGVHSSPRRNWGWVTAATAAAVLAAVVVVTTTDIFAPHKSGELAVILESQQVNRSTGQQEISENLESLGNLTDLVRLEGPKVQGGLAKQAKRASQSPATASIAPENPENPEKPEIPEKPADSDNSTSPAAQPANTHSAQSTKSTQSAQSTQSHTLQSSTLLADATPRRAAKSRAPLTLGIRNAGANGGSTSVVPGSPVFTNTNISRYYSSMPVSSAPALRDVNEGNYVFNHNPEYSLGLTVALEPIERFILESGLVWTTLSSQVVSFASTREQRIQYLGLPLYAGWRFIEHGAFSLTASAGATAERCLSANLGTWKQDERPWQFSVGAQIGIRYDLGHNFGLAFEPGVNYHLTETVLTTSRTDHPWSLSLRLTLQYTL
ncbi:MAG: hypothetical protein IKH59_08590 [Bacteroidaceae bacterium]|nr:hypothetical protein [Bacteroidaceae bacterium]